MEKSKKPIPAYGNGEWKAMHEEGGKSEITHLKPSGNIESAGAVEILDILLKSMV